MSELMPCPFCGGTNIRKPEIENGWLCEKCGSERFGDWNARPLEDALRKRIGELESTNEVCNDALNAYDKQRSEIVKLSNDTVNKLIARAERAEAMVEKLIERGLKLAFSTTYQTKEQSDWLALVTEWKAREK